MSEHTKDPWSVEADPNCDAATLLDADGNDTILRGDYQDWWVTKADARRIVACVNACKGIATETLETLEDKTLNELFKRNCGEYQGYVVFKVKDVLAHLSACEMDRLQELVAKVEAGRANREESGQWIHQSSL